MTVLSAPVSRLISLRRSSFLARNLRECSVALAYSVLLALLGVFHPAFFRDQFRTTAVSAAPLLILAVGMTLVIVSRQIDISIGSQFSVCGIVAGLLAAAHVPAPLVVAGTIAAGAILGAINGLLVARAGLPSIVVTLATLVILRGGLMWSTDGAAVRFPPGFQWFGLSQSMGRAAIVGAALLVFAVFAWALRWLVAGRTIFAVGSDPEAARLAGIRPRTVVFSTFVIMGALTAIAALLNAFQFALIYPNAGEGLEFKVIAAVVVGGAAITGGRGTLAGTLLGVLLLATIDPALIFFAPRQAHWAGAIQGAIILLSVSSDALAPRTPV